MAFSEVRVLEICCSARLETLVRETSSCQDEYVRSTRQQIVGKLTPILLEGWYRGITIVGKSTLRSGSTAVQWAVVVIRALPTGRDAYDKIGQYLLDAS